MDFNLLDWFIPEVFTASGRRQPFQGVPWRLLREELPSLARFTEEESSKKIARLDDRTKKSFRADEANKLKKDPWDTFFQTTADMKSTLGHYCAFIRLVEGRDTPLDLAMFFDATHLAAWCEFLRRYARSSKTHRNKSFHLVSLLKWMQTFSAFGGRKEEIKKAKRLLRRFGNNTKLNAKNELPANYTAEELTEKGLFMEAKEMVTYFSWILERWKELVAAFDPSRGLLDIAAAHECQRLLITLVLGLSGGLRREVIGRLRVDGLRYASNDVLLTIMDREKVQRRKTNRIPLPQMLSSYFEFFLQHARPRLLVGRTAEGKRFNPNTLWVNEKGGTLALQAVSQEVKRLSRRFNPFLNVTPLQFRRMAITKVFEGKDLENMDFERFLMHLGDYLNVERPVIKDYYNRFSVLAQNVRMQQDLQRKQFPGLEKDIMQGDALNRPLLQTKAISCLVPSVGRPVRTIVDDKGWARSLSSQLKKRARDNEKHDTKSNERRSSSRRCIKKACLEKDWSSEEEYEVKKVLDKKVEDGQVFYSVKWRGFTQPSWEPESNMGNAKQAVKDYESTI